MASPPRIPGRLQGRWSRLPIGSRLAAAFGVVLLLTAVLGAFSIIALTRVNAASDEVAMKWLPGVSHLASARAAVLELRELEVRHSRADDAGYMAEYEDKMRAARGRADEHLAATGRLVNDDEDRRLFAVITKAWPEYLKVHDRVIGFKAAADRADARDISDGAAKMAADDVLAAIDTLSAHGFEESQDVAQAAHALFVQARGWVVGLALLALLAGVAAAVSISTQLIRQLGGEPHEAAELARAVAAGDLSTPVRLRAGDHASLMAQLREMQLALGRVVATVRSGSEGVATASAEIAQGNNDLSGRTETQASALQQTTASMSQLGETVMQNADNARQADQLARSASAVALRGGEVVGQVVDTMKGINESSKKIADITGVIDGIAFQTNILALNAAVEAARAGEQGRGFAVVAGEVRSLAQRSAEAAKEIKTLIAASVQRVEQGTAQVDRAGETMAEVVQSIRRVTDIVNEISTASSEQSAGVRQVGEAITQMDHTTQQNAALVEESAAAAESLRQQAQQLVQAVAVFRLAA